MKPIRLEAELAMRVGFRSARRETEYIVAGPIQR